MDGLGSSCRKANTRVVPSDTCRMCLWHTSPMFSLFGPVCKRNRSIEKYRAIFGYTVEKNDGRPCNICGNCSYKLDLFYDFTRIVRTSHDLVGSYLHAVPDAVNVRIPAHPSLSRQFVNEDTDPSQNVVPHSENAVINQNDVPGCSTSHNIECEDDSVFIEPQNVESDDDSIIYEPIDIDSIEQDVVDLEDTEPNANNDTGDNGKQEIGNRGDLEDTSASLANQTPVIGGESHPNESADLPSSTSSNNQQAIAISMGNKLPLYSCDKCPEKLFTKVQLEQHYCSGSEFHPNESADLPSSTSRSNQQAIVKSMGKKLPLFSCNRCPEKFFTKVQLELHYCNSLSSSSVSCRYCQKQFSDRTELSAHKKLHLSVFSENCRRCGEVFHSRKALTVHKSTECIARGGSRPNTPLNQLHECRICSRDFNSLAGKKIHKASREHRANIIRHSLKMKASGSGRLGYKKTGNEIENRTNIVQSSHPMTIGNAESELSSNDVQTRYPRIRRRTYSDSEWLVG